MILNLVLFISLFLLSACNKNNYIYLKFHPHYSLHHFVKADSNFYLLKQVIKYNVPHSIDEEFNYTLNIEIPKNIPLNKFFDIEDSLIYNTNYMYFSIWDFDPDDYKIEGKIKLKSIDKKKIIIKENILIHVDNGRKIIERRFVGRRKFLL